MANDIENNFSVKDYVTLVEAAQRSGISVDRLRRLIKSGRLQTLQLAGAHTPHLLRVSDLTLLTFKQDNFSSQRK
tara:strand:+ start:187 stop:411 length:225 start_codon:yes stop_codon:yes gene_type:complete